MWYQAFTVNDQSKRTQNGMGQYVGGDLQWAGGQAYFGGVAAGGHIVLQEAGVDGPVLGGGDLSGTGSVLSTIQLQGTNQLPPQNVIGSVQVGVPYVPPLDLAALAGYFRCYSTDLARLPDFHAVTPLPLSGSLSGTPGDLAPKIVPHALFP